MKLLCAVLLGSATGFLPGGPTFGRRHSIVTTSSSSLLALKDGEEVSNATLEVDTC